MEGLRDLRVLRETAARLRSADEIGDWLHFATGLGIDPL